MRISVTNTTSPAATLTFPLPDGGVVKAATTRIFENVEVDHFENVARYRLDEAVAEGDCTYKILGNEDLVGDSPIRIQLSHSITWTHADFVAATQTEAIADDFEFPAGAVLEGYSRKNGVAFAANSLVDIGFNAATDVLEDGQVLTGTTEVYGAGTNALPYAKRDIAGRNVAAVFDSGNGNTTAGWTAGSFTANIFYSIPA